MILHPFILLTIVVLSITGTQLCLKKAVLSFGELSLSLSNFLPIISKLIKSGWLWLCAFLFAIGFVGYFTLLSKIELGTAYPIVVSGGIVLTALVSWFVFKEQISLAQVIGIALIILGIGLLMTKIK